MWAFLILLAVQTEPHLSVPGWSVWSSPPLAADAEAAAYCIRRHRGSVSLRVPMRCRIADGVRLADCEVADDQRMNRRNLETLQCVARAQRLPEPTISPSIDITVRVAAL